jgi:AcrR family transcriptional regulator
MPQASRRRGPHGRLAPVWTIRPLGFVHGVVNAVDILVDAGVPCRRMEETVAATGPEESPRVPLDRDRIIAAAETIVAAEGLGRLTMRRIGAELGADPTAVYRHFRNKDELLVQLADRMFGTPPELDPDMDWRERFKAELRHGVDRYRQHPELAALLARQPVDTPSLQAIAEHELALLTELGVAPRDAAFLLQLIENHVVGTGLYYALIENGQDVRALDPAAIRRAYALLPADRYPHASALAPHLFPDLDGAFDFGTDLILDAIERLANPTDGASS